MLNASTRKERRPIGQAWLRQELGLKVPTSAVESYLVAGARRVEVNGSRIVQLYPRQYATGESPASHLRFMLRHEAVDLGVLVASLGAIDPGELETWVRTEPTGATVGRGIPDPARSAPAARTEEGKGPHRVTEPERWASWAPPVDEPVSIASFESITFSLGELWD